MLWRKMFHYPTINCSCIAPQSLLFKQLGVATNGSWTLGWGSGESTLQYVKLHLGLMKATSLKQ